MLRKAMINLESEKGEHKFVFSMPVGSPLGSAYDAAFEVLQEILKMAQEAAALVEQNKGSNEDNKGE